MGPMEPGPLCQGLQVMVHINTVYSLRDCPTSPRGMDVVSFSQGPWALLKPCGPFGIGPMGPGPLVGFCLHDRLNFVNSVGVMSIL